MVEIVIDYQGNLRCQARHGPSAAEILTDAPLDNHGKGESFSPTDLVAAALGTCVATIMGIYAERHDIDLRGMRIHVEKHMQTEPRRIARLPVTVQLPISLGEKHKKALAAAAEHCPVHASLHPDIDAPIILQFSDETELS